MAGMRQRAVEGLRPGDKFVLRRTFSNDEMQAFGDLTRDYNPVHHDARFAPRGGHGMGELGPHLRRQRVHLVGPVERDRADAVGQVVGDGLIIHGVGPPVRRV